MLATTPQSADFLATVLNISLEHVQVFSQMYELYSFLMSEGMERHCWTSAAIFITVQACAEGCPFLI